MSAFDRHHAVRIAFIGGLDRLESELEQAAAAMGIVVECHDGGMSPRSRDKLDALMRRSHGAIVFTGVNSHAAVHLAKKLGTRYGTHVLLVKNPGSTKARQLLLELAAGIAGGAERARIAVA